MNPIFIFLVSNPYLTGFLIFILAVILGSIKQINQYEKGVKFMLGKYIGLMEPG